MLIQTDEKAVALTPLGTISLNARATASRSASKSWMELILAAFGQARHSDQPKQD
jgi:hypothetical protein